MKTMISFLLLASLFVIYANQDEQVWKKSIVKDGQAITFQLLQDAPTDSESMAFYNMLYEQIKKALSDQPLLCSREISVSVAIKPAIIKITTEIRSGPRDPAPRLGNNGIVRILQDEQLPKLVADMVKGLDCKGRK